MLEKIIISIIFGYIMGSTTTILLILFMMVHRRDYLQEWGKALANKWHKYWANYHVTVMVKMRQDGGTFGQYYTDKHKRHYARFSYHEEIIRGRG